MTTPTTLEPPSALARDRSTVLRLSAPARGPTLVCVGGLHGNEPAGVAALERVSRALALAGGGLGAGDLVALIGNRPALHARRRFLELDLNRGWGQDCPSAAPPGPTLEEEAERRRIHDTLQAARAQARGPCFFLDLHTTSAPSHPFTSALDALPSRWFAAALAAPVVLGLDDALPGTLTRHADELGYVALSFEAGQHEDPRSVDYAEAAVWLALERAGLLERALSAQRCAPARALFDGTGWEARHMFDVIHRHALERANDFRMRPGRASFERVARGEPLARERGGEVSAPAAGYLLMPLYQAQGEDGFFVMREYGRLRQLFSRGLRRLRVERLIACLAGVRHPAPDELLLPPALARRAPMRRLLHLLGYRSFSPSRAVVEARRRRQHIALPPRGR